MAVDPSTPQAAEPTSPTAGDMSARDTANETPLSETTTATDAPSVSAPDPLEAFRAHLASVPERERRRLLGAIPEATKAIEDEINARTQRAFQTAQRQQEKADRQAKLQKVASGEDLDTAITFATETAKKELEKGVRETLQTELLADPNWQQQAKQEMLVHSVESLNEHPLWGGIPQEVVDRAWAEEQSVPRLFGAFFQHLVDTKEVYWKKDVDKLLAAAESRGRDTARGEITSPDIGGTTPSGDNGRHTFTREELRTMSRDFWRTNKNEIERQAAAGLIR